MRKFVIAVFAVVAAAVGVDLLTFDRAAWAADYSAMKRGMAQHYANLGRR